MPLMPTDRLAVFAAVFAILYTAHKLGDHWIQTNGQASAKGGEGWPARIACAAHVATYSATCVVGLLALAWCTGLALPPDTVTLALGVNAVTHYVADRREPLRRIARWLGRTGYLQHATVIRRADAGPDTTGPGTALFHLDESWHVVWLAVAALIIA